MVTSRTLRVAPRQFCIKSTTISEPPGQWELGGGGGGFKHPFHSPVTYSARALCTKLFSGVVTKPNLAVRMKSYTCILLIKHLAFFQILRAVLPHISLYVGSIVYLLVGAHIFILLERPFQNKERWNQTMRIEHLENSLLDQIYTTETLGADDEFDGYVKELFYMHRYALMRPQFVDANMTDNYNVDRINDFGFVVFFVLSMTSTIGEFR